MFNTLFSLSPLDGRYQEKVNALRDYFSEYAFMRYRLIIEIRWLEALSEMGIPEYPPLSSKGRENLKEIIKNFSINEAEKIKAIEKITNHDLKAIEYYLKTACQAYPELNKTHSFIHFAATSEDINNLAYGLMIKDSLKNVMLPTLFKLHQTLYEMAQKTAAIPLLARTHGQAATPTTLGKEIANFAERLKRQIQLLRSQILFGKMNGAVGNFNAHTLACPEVDWIKESQKFIRNLGLEPLLYTTQIEPHDYLAELFDNMARINTLLIDFNRDIWGYIALNYFTQALKPEEVGSSTMPHKINPIDFENSEGNLGIASALFAHFSAKLPISRWQRDLSDSTTLRNIGVAMGHSLIAFLSTLNGLEKIQPNKDVLEDDLNNHWPVLAEALQTVMRRYGIDEAYEQIKTLSRGKNWDKHSIKTFIEDLKIPSDIKETLKELEPKNYLGKACELSKAILPMKIDK